MQARLSITGADVLCSRGGGGAENERRLLIKDNFKQMQAFAEAYEAAVKAHASDALAPLGQDIFAWLDGGTGWARGWVDAPGDRARSSSAAPPSDQLGHLGQQRLVGTGNRHRR